LIELESSYPERFMHVLEPKKAIKVNTNFQSELQMKQSSGANPNVINESTVATIKRMI
jgi:hypothetical protein